MTRVMANGFFLLGHQTIRYLFCISTQSTKCVSFSPRRISYSIRVWLSLYFISSQTRRSMFRKLACKDKPHELDLNVWTALRTCAWEKSVLLGCLVSMVMKCLLSQLDLEHEALRARLRTPNEKVTYTLISVPDGNDISSIFELDPTTLRGGDSLVPR